MFLAIFVSLLSVVMGQWPCPNREDIAPCVCIYDDAGAQPHFLLDCSPVESEIELSLACNGPFPFTDFQYFILRNSEISELKANSLGELSFVEIDISSTNIENVEEGTFDGSSDTARSFILTNSFITSFPSTFSTFQNLVALDMSNNVLEHISIDSTSLLEIDLNNNNISSITLKNLLSLEAIQLDNNKLEAFPSISYFQSLKFVNMEGNDIRSLADDAFGSPFHALDSLVLSSNGLQCITPSSFAGMIFKENTKLDLSSNDVEYLDERNWGELLKYQIPDNCMGILDLTDNPILCGCEIQWLVGNSTFLGKINAATTCNTGNLLTEVDLDILASLCNST